MDFGISLLPDVLPSVRTAREYYQDVFALCNQAEDEGMRYVKMTEHYLHPYGGYCPNPLSFLAAVAAQTKDIRLMTGCVLPAFHHPVKLASWAMQVDAISGGRLDVGFARAYLPYEFETFGIPLNGSRERFEASIHAIERLWKEENVSIDTPFFSFSDATILPRPTSSPHPPILIAAVKTHESFIRIGRMGHGLLVTPSGLEVMTSQIEAYRENFVYTNSATPSPRIVASLPLFVAETDQEATKVADYYLRRYLDVWASACDSWNNTTSPDYASYTGMARYIRTLTEKDLRLTGSAIVGSPSTVRERIEQLVSEVGGGLDTIIWQVDFGGMPYSVSGPSLELFNKEVAPYFL